MSTFDSIVKETLTIRSMPLTERRLASCEKRDAVTSTLDRRSRWRRKTKA
jgi:hypothetical protein